MHILGGRGEGGEAVHWRKRTHMRTKDHVCTKGREKRQRVTKISLFRTLCTNLLNDNDVKTIIQSCRGFAVTFSLDFSPQNILSFERNHCLLVAVSRCANLWRKYSRNCASEWGGAMSRDWSPYLFSVKNFFTSLISIQHSGASLCRMMLMTSTLMAMQAQRSFPRYLQEICTFQQVLPQRFLFWTCPSLKDIKD